MFWNVEYLTAVVSKAPDIRLFDNLDLILLCETMCNEEDAASILNNYYVEAMNLDVHSRGLVVASKSPMKLLSKTRSHIAVEVANFNVIGVAFYFVPNTPVDDIVIEVAEVIADLNDDPPVLLAGDFNCRMDSGSRGVELCTALHDLNFSMVPNTAKTYIGHNGESLIDLVFFRAGKKQNLEVKNLTVHQTQLRKHAQIRFNLHVRNIQTSNESRPSGIARKLDVENLQTCPAALRLDNCIAEGNLEGAMSSMKECIASSLQTRRKKWYKPWFDRQCLLKKETAVHLYHRRHDSLSSRENYLRTKREYKRLCTAKKSEYEEKKLLDRLTEAESKPWILLNNRHNSRAAKVSMEDIVNHFQELLDPSGEPPTLPKGVRSETENDWYNEPYTIREVERVIVKSKSGKAVGPDGIANEHIKQSAEPFLQQWRAIFNMCLTQEVVPKQWTESFLKVLYKGKGDPNIPSAYRGISLLSCPYKMLTSLMNGRIMAHVEDKLPDNQHGFRQHRSTRTPLARLLQRALKEKDNGGLWVLFVDFRAAFPSLDRATLLRKLENQFAIRGHCLGLIRELLKGTTFRIDDGVSLSEKLNEHKGVPQGDSLSPTLFLCYVTDLSDSLRTINERSLNHAFFADDLETDSPNSDDIQHALDAIEIWSNENLIDVNLQKTKIMKFRKGGRVSRQVSFSYKGEPVDIVNEYEYLGVTLQPTLTFTKHIRKKIAKCAAVTGSLRNLQRASMSVAMKIFKLKVRPIIEYGLTEISPFLTTRHLVDIDRIKTTYLKIALGLHKNVPNTLTLMIAGENSLTEDLKEKLDIRENIWTDYLQQRETKIESVIENDYLLGPAFMCDRWRKTNQRDRHFITRFTAHGFHFKICDLTHFHDADECCVCRLCGEKATRYHLTACAAAGKPFAQFVLGL